MCLFRFVHSNNWTGAFYILLFSILSFGSFCLDQNMQAIVLPNTVLHSILTNYLTAHDQLNFAKLFRGHLFINNQSLAAILRRAVPTDLRHLSAQIITDSDRYLASNDHVTERISNLNWSITLERAFDITTFNRTWGHFSTPLFSLYSRLFSYSPFFYRPQYPLVDVFNVPCKFAVFVHYAMFFIFIEHQ